MKIISNFTQAITSLDFQRPKESGSIHDNNTNQNFIHNLISYFGHVKFSLLDFGCAGGQFVIDINKTGNLALGIDGGNKECMVLEGKGKHNWLNYENKFLFFIDATHPFKVTNDIGEDFLFDIITSFDFLEHVTPEEVPAVISNMKKHLKLNGTLLHQINLSSGGLHQCGREPSWWDKQFSEFGFRSFPYPFNRTIRSNKEGYCILYRIKT